MNKDEVKKRLDRIEEDLNELNDMDFEKFSIYPKISNAIHLVSDIKKEVFTPPRPEKCEGFIGDCDRKPTKYDDLHDVWLCVSCWNEKYEHYAR